MVARCLAPRTLEALSLNHCPVAHCSPYQYGYAVETSVGDGGIATVTKWYTLGRNSKELAYVSDVTDLLALELHHPFLADTTHVFI
jgi:hypothetical protein